MSRCWILNSPLEKTWEISKNTRVWNDNGTAKRTQAKLPLVWVFRFSWGTTRVWDTATVKEETNPGVIIWPEGAFSSWVVLRSGVTGVSRSPGASALNAPLTVLKSSHLTPHQRVPQLIHWMLSLKDSFSELVHVGISSWENSLPLGNTGNMWKLIYVYIYTVYKAVEPLCAEPKATTGGLKPGSNDALLYSGHDSKRLRHWQGICLL